MMRRSPLSPAGGSAHAAAWRGRMIKKKKAFRGEFEFQSIADKDRLSSGVGNANAKQ